MGVPTKEKDDIMVLKKAIKELENSIRQNSVRLQDMVKTLNDFGEKYNPKKNK